MLRMKISVFAPQQTKNKKSPLKSTISEGFWSEQCGSNARSPGPKPGAIPTSLYPDIQFLPLYHGEGENQRFFCLWSFMWSNPLLCRFRQSWKIPQTQASKGFAAFRLALSRIPPRHSQSRRATNCATPGYFVILSGWSYSPKPIGNTFSTRLQRFFAPFNPFYLLFDALISAVSGCSRAVCGNLCGQKRFPSGTGESSPETGREAFCVSERLHCNSEKAVVQVASARVTTQQLRRNQRVNGNNI